LIPPEGQMMRRREFIAGLGGAAALPLATRAQQPGRMRRIGVLMGYAASDPAAQALVAAFRHELRGVGWIEGGNIRIDERWAAAADIDLMRAYAAELVKLKPEVILCVGPLGIVSVQRENRDIPIVFATISDPVGLGFVQSLARPGGNVTGFTLFDRSAIGKLLEALKEFVPGTARVALLFNPENASAATHLRALETYAPSFSVAQIAAPVRNRDDIERAIEAFAREPNGGLIFPLDTVTSTHRELVIALAARHRLPAIYSDRSFVTDGGLMSYGIDQLDNYRRAAGYVDRILKGEKPADLPVQQPTKYQFALNLKTAKVLGLDVPTSILLRADEVIE
jgi:putative ABC transport system substrate-binding protein